MITLREEKVLRQICTSLDIDALAEILPDFKDHQVHSTIQRMWFLASDRQDVKSLNRLYNMSKNNDIWSVEKERVGKLVKSAITLNKGESVKWWLNNFSKDLVSPAVISAVTPYRIDNGPRDMTQSLCEVAKKYPNILSNVQMMEFHLEFLSFPTRDKDTQSLSVLLSFVRPAKLIDVQKKPISTSPTQKWWEAWSSNAKLDQLNFWHEEISRSSSMSVDFPLSLESKTVFHSAILQSNPDIENIVSEPPNTPAYEAVVDVFSNGDTSSPPLMGLIFSTPAKLARMLRKNTHFSKRVLNARRSNGENILHLCTRYRCRPGHEFSQSCLRWSHLETWIDKNALHLLRESDNLGHTPLDSILHKHPKWYSRLSRKLLSEVSNTAAPSKKPPLPRL